jgi:NNP family nitrate/nitrite transporter-like MFS transporter
MARRLRAGHWIEEWDPEDDGFWQRAGRRVAHRNLLFSVVAEHIGFSVWTLWSVMVLFMGPEYGIDAAGKFFLVAVPTLVGAVLRLPYTFAVAMFGGRNWTIVSAALLLVPTILAAIVMHPETSYTTFVVVACVAGLGGGNFASSMTNINTFFPERHKGWALGLNAGGGNIGVPVIQLVALLVIATAGAGSPRLVLAVYIPLIVVAAVLAAVYMDNITSVRNDTGAFAESVRENHTWVMAFLYIGTFGSFIGYSFAFGLVLQNQFDRTPLQAASITFIGPLLGSLIRPLGGKLADRFGGARVTFLNFIGMVMASGVIPRGVGFAIAHGLRGRLRAALRADRDRQRFDVQDDSGDLPGQGACGDRERRRPDHAADAGAPPLRRGDRHHRRCRRSRRPVHQPGLPAVVPHREDGRPGVLGVHRVLPGVRRRHVPGLPAAAPGPGPPTSCVCPCLR